MTSSPSRAALLALLAAALPALAALRGVAGPYSVMLKAGPGDGPFVTGFAPAPEMTESGAAHALGADAHVRLPLVVHGAVELAWTLKRAAGPVRATRVSLAGREVDVEVQPDRPWHERRVVVPGAGAVPLHLGFRSETAEAGENVLKLHEVAARVGEGGRVRLTAAAALRPFVLVLLVALLAWALGWPASTAAIGAAVVALPLAGGLLVDPWFAFRLLRGLPEGLAVFGAAGVAAAHLVRRRGAPGGDVAAVGALMVAAFLLRGAAVNHPAYYYPDLRTHVTLVETIDDAGARFFVSPSRWIAEHGVWVKKAYGRPYAYPYSPGLHVFFAPLRDALGYDGLMTAMKLTAAACAAVPIALLWALARRLGVSPLGAALTIALPTYATRLWFAFLGSIFGHVFDLAFVVFLAWHLRDRGKAPDVRALALLVSAAQLSYVSGVLNTALVVPLVALGLVATERREGLRRAGAVVAGGVLGALLSLALYYRDFLGMAWVVVSSGASGQQPSHIPEQPFLAVLGERVAAFFGWAWTPLALAGLAWMLRRGTGRVVLGAWAGAWLLILWGRASMPDAFAHAHEAMMVTPLVALAAGAALGRVAETGRAGRVAAACGVALLFAAGLWRQWSELATHLHRFG